MKLVFALTLVLGKSKSLKINDVYFIPITFNSKFFYENLILLAKSPPKKLARNKNKQECSPQTKKNF
jgi:hypothetical protein